jgi:HlyD family secretion protein
MTVRIIVTLVTTLGMQACQPQGNQHQMVGQLESDRIELAAEFSEPIISRSVNEGQIVSVGDIIIRQNPDRANARVREAEAALMQNQARLDELTRGPRKEQIVAAQANVDGAVQELAFRQTELERVRALLGRKLSSPGDHDRALAALDSAAASLDFNKARLAELLTGTTVEELDQARAAVMVAEAQRDRSQIDLDRLTTLAPVDGVIDSFLFETGERPISGQPMAIMLAGQQPYARIYVPADLRAHVAPGTEARVLAEGIEQPLKGRFRWIASEAAFTPYFALTEHDRGRLTYLAKIDIEVTGARLPDGIPVEVELVATGSIPE